MAAPAKPAAPAAPAEHRDWQGTTVPPEVHDALSKKWRGQPGIAARQAAVLDFFVETATLKLKECRPDDDGWWGAAHNYS